MIVVDWLMARFGYVSMTTCNVQACLLVEIERKLQESNRDLKAQIANVRSLGEEVDSLLRQEEACALQQTNTQRAIDRLDELCCKIDHLLRTQGDKTTCDLGDASY